MLKDCGTIGYIVRNVKDSSVAWEIAILTATAGGVFDDGTFCVLFFRSGGI